MPKLAAVIETLDAVNESVRGFYVEQDGKFVLDADVDGHPAVAGLKSALSKTRGERDLTAKELKAFRDLGYTADQIADLKAKSDSGNDKPDVEKLIEKRVKETEARYAKDLEERDQLRSDLRKLRLDDQVKAAALKAGMLPEDVEDEMDILLRGRVRRFDLDDKNKVQVLDDDGDPTGVSAEKWFTETYKTRKAKVFAGTAGSGAGTRGGTSGGGTSAGVIRLSREDAKDPRKYQAARALADKQGATLDIEPAA